MLSELLFQVLQAELPAAHAVAFLLHLADLLLQPGQGGGQELNEVVHEGHRQGGPAGDVEGRQAEPAKITILDPAGAPVASFTAPPVPGLGRIAWNLRPTAGSARLPG